ncbi:MAG: methyltransferase domain-containing protein [Candidatus Hodarchaeales archaeon]|jgi:hypothetical protein
MEISEHGYWIGHDPKEHRFDIVLGYCILQLAKSNRCYEIIDAGCGQGKYVELLQNAGMVCRGYDGNPETRELTNNTCRTLDFAKPVTIKPADMVVSLEVGEHIPEKFEQIFIKNLAHLAKKMIILSWAIPEQGGYGHVNCRDNIYIMCQVRKYGFIFNSKLSEYLRQGSTLSWFKRTLMVFKNNNENES